VPDPFGPIDPSTFLVPCPFPASSTTSVSDAGSEAGACDAEECPPPADLDGDGTYDDLTGNGRTEFADVILFFRNMNWIEENQPVCCFDYNANGNIDFSDVILLFKKVEERIISFSRFLPVPSPAFISFYTFTRSLAEGPWSSRGSSPAIRTALFICQNCVADQSLDRLPATFGKIVARNPAVRCWEGGSSKRHIVASTWRIVMN
jgi:hypothetical protein